MSNVFKSRWAKWMGIFTLSVVVCVYFFSWWSDRRMVTTLLRLDHFPSSARSINCESWGLTDVLSTCVFDIDPKDFRALLDGWKFERKQVSGGSFKFSSGPKLGTEFPVALEFSVEPSEFKYGGRVLMVTNLRQDRVQIDYYEE